MEAFCCEGDTPVSQRNVNTRSQSITAIAQCNKTQQFKTKLSNKQHQQQDNTAKAHRLIQRNKNIQ